MTGTSSADALQAPPVHRSVHPLPPKPTTGPSPPPPPPSSYVDNKSPRRQRSSSQNNGEAKSERAVQDRSRPSSNRRSASPPCKQETNYRKREYSKASTEDDGPPRVRGGADGKETAAKQPVPDNADVRRRGSAIMEVYR